MEGRGWNEASGDLLIPGIGWVSPTGVGDIKLLLSLPKGCYAKDSTLTSPKPHRETGVREVYLRQPAMLPFEVKSSTVTSSGLIY